MMVLTTKEIIKFGPRGLPNPAQQLLLSTLLVLLKALGSMSIKQSRFRNNEKSLSLNFNVTS